MTPHPRATLSATGLDCVRGERRLFGGLAFELGNGGLLQVSGPNGSGKTSLLRMVCGLLPPAAGTIEWNGTRIRALAEEYNASLVYIGHLNAAKEELNARETLGLAARLAGLPADPAPVAAALGDFGLAGSDRLPCKVLSQGQKRRLALARLKLSASRALWVLDEPFAALDAAGIAVMRAVLEDHLARGGLALLTTHQAVPVAAPAAQTIELGT
jgi:heme exporter protein A